MTSTTSNKPSSPIQSILQRRLARQPRLTRQHYPGETFHSTVAVTISLPARSSSSYSWPSSPVPQPLPLPQSPMTPPPDHHATLPFTRHTVDHDAVRRSNSSSNFATLTRNEKSNLKLNIPPVAVTISLPSSPPHRSRSYHHRSSSAVPQQLPLPLPESPFTPLPDHHHATSTPTSIFTSPVTSSGRLSSGYLSDPSINSHQDFNTLLPKTDHSSRSLGNQTTKYHKGSHSHHLKFYSSDWSENNHASAHPLPLPPRASSQSEQSPVQHLSSVTLYHSTENFHSIKSHWQKGKLIGRGSSGSVYHATNLETGASCAMKEVDLFLVDPKWSHYIKQLEQEIRTLGQLHHLNIMQYYGGEVVGDRLCIYMEYVNPGSLHKFMQQHNGALTESVVRNFTRHILSGLAYLHSTDTIHRDIKGANLLVDPSGIVQLADFGVSKFMAEKSYEVLLKRSPYWMAPELMVAALLKKTNPNVTTAVDIWSLGCTIIEMLTGKSPWSEFSGHRVTFKVLHRSPKIPETLSPEGRDFLEQCFRRNPADRPSAAVLLTHAFVQNLHEQDVIVQSLGTPPKDELGKYDQGNRSKTSRGVTPAFFRAFFAKFKI